MVYVSVTVDDQHLQEIEVVAAALRDRGMSVEQVLDVVGVITGEVEPGAAEALRGIAGVSSVDSEQRFQLPPPDSPIQ